MAKAKQTTDEKPEVEDIPTDEKGVTAQPAAADLTDNDDWQHAAAQIWEPKPGDVLQGTYDGAAPFTEGTLDTEVDKHFVIDAKGARFSFVGGSVFDKAVKGANEGAGIKPGMEVRITFKGKKDLKKDGKRVNIFEILYRQKKK